MGAINGYAGKILWVDLSIGRARKRPTESYVDLFLGGRGIAAKIYWDEVPPECDAFHPENRLIFITGPLSASTGFAGSRWQVCGKSPLHDRFSYCNLGGAWGAMLKHAGYDGLVIYGKADSPVYLVITETDILIKTAAHLVGMGAITCRQEIKKQLGTTTRVVAIGPAGENGVVFSTFLADSDSSGSSGLASVMGSKNLKAIAVSGKKKPSVADPDRVEKLKKRFHTLTGTPKRDVRTASVIVPREKLKPQICYGCTGGCPRANYRDEEGSRAKFMCQGMIFYETRAQRYYKQYTDTPFIANKLCDDFGLDTHGTESLIAWLVRAYNAGLLTEEETGLPFSKIGSREFIEALVRKVAFREGVGELLAEGTHKAAEAFGTRGLELIKDYISNTGYSPVYGARLYLTTGLFWAMEPRLPIQLLHEVSMLGMRWAARENGHFDTGLTSEIFRAIARRFWGSDTAADFSTYEGKALAGVKIQDRQYAKESLIVCDFLWPVMFSPFTRDKMGDPTLESRLLSAVTGRDMDEAGLYRVGERVFNFQRAIHAREKRKGREHDALEEFNFTIPLKGDFGNPECLVPGKNGKPFSRKGLTLDRDEFEKMKDEYYEIREWDPATGLQTREKLEALNLGDVAEELGREGLLAQPAQKSRIIQKCS